MNNRSFEIINEKDLVELSKQEAEEALNRKFLRRAAKKSNKKFLKSINRKHIISATKAMPD